MKSHDGAQLSAQLGRLAETYDRKPLTGEALKVWFDTLKEFPAEMIFGLLSSWAKQHGKFPIPSEVWSIANNIGMADRERAAAQLASEVRQPVRFQRTEAGKRALAEIKSLTGPKPTPRETWHRCMSLNEPGSFQHDMAVAALAKLNHRRAEPQDLEEAA